MKCAPTSKPHASGDGANADRFAARLGLMLNVSSTIGGDGGVIRLQFEATVIHWRGPAPFFFARIPTEHAAEIRRVKKAASYGWGVIPVRATIKGVTFETSLFPKNETYLLPLKDAVRRKIEVTADDEVEVEMSIETRLREPGR
jgi:hypothetical protein